MTLIEAITQADETNRNTYPLSQKITWLSRVEALVKKSVIDAHEGTDRYPFSEFNDDTPHTTVLIMPQPYDECYIHWLQAQVHYANDEIERYNHSMMMFNALLDGFKGYYKRDNMPKNSGRFRF